MGRMSAAAVLAQNAVRIAAKSKHATLACTLRYGLLSAS